MRTTLPCLSRCEKRSEQVDFGSESVRSRSTMPPTPGERPEQVDFGSLFCAKKLGTASVRGEGENNPLLEGPHTCTASGAGPFWGLLVRTVLWCVLSGS